MQFGAGRVGKFQNEMDALCVGGLNSEVSELQGFLIGFDYEQMISDVVVRALQSFQIERRQTHFRHDSVRQNPNFSSTQPGIMGQRSAAEKKNETNQHQHLSHD